MTDPVTGLMIWAIGQHALLELAPEEVKGLREAVEDLREMVDIEQKFDLVISNFVEHERELAERVLIHTYRGIHSEHDLHDDKLAFARRILNLLSAGRLYIDQVKHHMTKLFPDNQETQAEVVEHFSDQYKSSLGYRVMEALRNYSQHRGMPVHG